MVDEQNPLSSIGEVDGTEADERFADRLEASLRVSHAQLRPTRQPLWRRLSVAGSVMVVLLVLTSVALLARDEAPSAALVLTNASNVIVHLPDGTSVEDPADGYLLIDGAVIEVRDGGVATIDDVTVDSAALFTVRDGLLVTDVAGTTTTDRSPDTTTVSATDAPATDAPVTDGPISDAPNTDEATTTLAPTTTIQSETTTVAPRSPSVDQAPPDDHARPDDDHDDAPHPPVDDRDHGRVALEISLRVRVIDAGVRVVWNVVGGEDGWTTIVVREVGDSESRVTVESDLAGFLSDAAVTVVSEVGTTDHGEVLDSAPRDEGRISYRVIVLDGEGGVVGSSPPQSLGR